MYPLANVRLVFAAEGAGAKGESSVECALLCRSVGPGSSPGHPRADAVDAMEAGISAVKQLADLAASGVSVSGNKTSDEGDESADRPDATGWEASLRLARAAVREASVGTDRSRDTDPMRILEAAARSGLERVALAARMKWTQAVHAASNPSASSSGVHLGSNTSNSESNQDSGKVNELEQGLETGGGAGAGDGLRGPGTGCGSAWVPVQYEPARFEVRILCDRLDASLIALGRNLMIPGSAIVEKATWVRVAELN